MASEVYEGRDIRVVSFDDVTSGEYVIEFIDPATSITDSVMAIFNSTSTWDNARVSLSPRADGVSAEFVSWALGVARRMTEDDVK